MSDFANNDRYAEDDPVATVEGGKDDDDMGAEDHNEPHAKDGQSNSSSKKRKRPEPRKLMRWDPGVDQLVLLTLANTCARNGTELPGDEIAREIRHSLSGEAIKQHLGKVYDARLSYGQQVPEIPEESLNRRLRKLVHALNTKRSTESSLLFFKPNSSGAATSHEHASRSASAETEEMQTGSDRGSLEDTDQSTRKLSHARQSSSTNIKQRGSQPEEDSDSSEQDLPAKKLELQRRGLDTVLDQTSQVAATIRNHDAVKPFAKPNQKVSRGKNRSKMVAALLEQRLQDRALHPYDQADRNSAGGRAMTYGVENIANPDNGQVMNILRRLAQANNLVIPPQDRLHFEPYAIPHQYSYSAAGSRPAFVHSNPSPYFEPPVFAVHGTANIRSSDDGTFPPPYREQYSNPFFKRPGQSARVLAPAGPVVNRFANAEAGKKTNEPLMNLTTTRTETKQAQEDNSHGRSLVPASKIYHDDVVKQEVGNRDRKDG